MRAQLTIPSLLPLPIFSLSLDAAYLERRRMPHPEYLCNSKILSQFFCLSLYFWSFHLQNFPLKSIVESGMIPNCSNLSYT